MNEWVSKSIELANAPGYLDRLHAIYPVIPETTRPLPAATLQRLAEVYAVGDDQELVRTCLLLPKFPVKDPYVAFLRKREKFLEQNPQTVHRLAQRIRALGYEGLMIAVEEPKEFDRQIGTLFKRWLPSLGYPFWRSMSWSAAWESLSSKVAIGNSWSLPTACWDVLSPRPLTGWPRWEDDTL